MPDNVTVEVYNKQAQTYAKLVSRDKPDQDLLNFAESLPPQAFVLDLGCGPANASAMLKDMGYRVDPVDASPTMVELANETYNIGARIASFDEIDETETYDGIWANFSLLHAPRSAFKGHLTRLNQALKPGGILHLGMKLGEGEKRDELGRFYAFYSQQELVTSLQQTGFEVLTFKLGKGPGLAGTIDPWITILTHKA